jgi:type II secretory pathway pseudopilin PulG
MVRRLRKPRRKGAGMTLIEVLVALLLATIALLGALALLLTSTRGGAFARNMTEASILAQSKLEERVTMTGVTTTTSPLVPPNGAETVETTLNALGKVDTAAGIFTRTTTWGLVTAPDGSLRRSITVTVAWLDAAGKGHAVTAARDRAP